MKEVILSTKDLCRSFVTNGEKNHVLSNITLDIYKGDFTVVMGASGTGKSTLLYGLSGMDRVTSGEILFKGKDITKMSDNKLALLHQKGFGFVFQQMHLVSNLTLFENVAVPGYLDKSVSAKEVQKRAEELLEAVNLKEAKKRLPSQVSGGEQQRAAIARAMIHKPDILFADEPTGALNRKNSMDVLDLLTSLNEDGQSVIMVTHDLKAATRASRILYLDDGKVAGELSLSPYSKEERKSRETQINAWLSSMSW